MGKTGRVLYPLNFRIDKQTNFLLHFAIVGFNGFFERVAAFFVSEISYIGDALIGFHIRRDFDTIHNNLRMENLLVDVFRY